MGGLAPAWYRAAADDVPEGWLITSGGCRECNGRGRVWVNHDDGHAGGLPHKDLCEPCHGTGLAGVRWECRRAGMDWDVCEHELPVPTDVHFKCGLVLVIPLERNE